MRKLRRALVTILALTVMLSSEQTNAQATVSITTVLRFQFASNSAAGATLLGDTTLTNPCAIEGIIYVSGAGCYTTFASALAACASPGCTVDARRASTVTRLGIIDPGTTFPVTILLGPYSYTLQQLTLRSGLHLIGFGSAPNGNGTTITQSNASVAPIQLPGAGQTYPNNVARNVYIGGFDLEAATNSTTDLISLVCNKDVASIGGGLWYSELNDITIGNSSAVGRNSIRLDTTAGGSPPCLNQWVEFDKIFALRNTNRPPVLMITGPQGQMLFQNSQFDGNPSAPDTSASYNIRLDDGGTTFLPYSITFLNVVTQNAWSSGSAAIYVGGASNVIFEGCHFEHDNGVIVERGGPGGHGDTGIVIRDSYMATNTGIDRGNGFIADLDSGASLGFYANSFWGTPDQSFIGSSVAALDIGVNWNPSNGGVQPWNQINMGTGIPVGSLPSASANPGKMIYVTDSTAIASEGQTCVGRSDTKAIAISNGNVWKCF